MSLSAAFTAGEAGTSPDTDAARQGWTPTSDMLRRKGVSVILLLQITKPKWSLSHLAVGLSDTWLSTDIKFKHLQMAVHPVCWQAVYIFTHSMSLHFAAGSL